MEHVIHRLKPRLSRRKVAGSIFAAWCAIFPVFGWQWAMTVLGVAVLVVVLLAVSAGYLICTIEDKREAGAQGRGW